MHEGMTVPLSAIPERAWGMAAAGLDAGQVAAQDPFCGRGLRIDISDLPWVTLAHVQEATGITQVAGFANDCIWIDLGEGNPEGDRQATEEVQTRWGEWLRKTGPPTLP